MSTFGFSAESEPKRTFLHTDDNEDAPKRVYAASLTTTRVEQYDHFWVPLTARVSSRFKTSTTKRGF
jgi:hypothetical protein